MLKKHDEQDYPHFMLTGAKTIMIWTSTLLKLQIVLLYQTLLEKEETSLTNLKEQPRQNYLLVGVADLIC